MTIHASEELQRLCSDYYHGLLPRELYRQRRAALVDALILGEEKTRPDSATRPAEKPATHSAELTETPPDERIRRAPRLVAGAIVFVLAILAFALMYFYVDNTSEQLVADQASSSQMEPATPDEAGLGDFVADFLDANQWSARSVSDFLFDWDDLDLEEQDILADTDVFRSFVQELEEQIKVQKALGTEEEAARLLQFGTELGLAFEWAIVGDPPSSAQAARPPADAGSPVGALLTPPVSDQGNLNQEGVAEAVVVVEKASDTGVPESSEPSQPESDRTEEPLIESPSVTPGVETRPVELAMTDETSLAPAAASAGETDAARHSSESGTTNERFRSERECSASLLSTRRRSCWDMVAKNVRGPAMVVIEPGTFTMGSDDDPVAGPAFDVEIERPFAMSIWEITAGEYMRFCTESERDCPKVPDGGDDYPITRVSWEDANQFAAWLTQRTGHVYRLPTEAEWEYCARAASTSRFPFGDSLYPGDAIFSVDRELTAPVSRSHRDTERNAFKLWHMIGNVREWVADGWHESHRGAPGDGNARPASGPLRVVRGGSFRDGPDALRSAAREGVNAGDRDAETGIRLVRELAAN